MLANVGVFSMLLVSSPYQSWHAGHASQFLQAAQPLLPEVAKSCALSAIVPTTVNSFFLSCRRYLQLSRNSIAGLRGNIFDILVAKWPGLLTEQADGLDYSIASAHASGDLSSAFFFLELLCAVLFGSTRLCALL